MRGMHTEKAYNGSYQKDSKDKTLKLGAKHAHIHTHTIYHIWVYDIMYTMTAFVMERQLTFE